MDAFLEFVTHHWYFAFPMFAISIVAVALTTWRILLNMNSRTDMNLFMPKFQEVLAKEGVDGALRFCKAQPETEMIPRKLFVAGLENAKQGLAAMRRGMANVMELEIIPDLNFALPTILAIAKIATMVGLLGTVISMIGTFQELGKAAETGGGGQASASQQIGLALFATALGLVTAIPLVFAHVLFKAWIHKQEVKMKNYGQKLVLLVQAWKNGTLTPPVPAAPPGAPGQPGQPGQPQAARPMQPAAAGAR